MRFHVAAAKAHAPTSPADDGGTQKVDVFKAKGTERSRGGYEDGAVVLFKRATVEEFLQVRGGCSAACGTSTHPTLTQNDDPVRILTDYTEIVFASALCRQARALACTTQETLECLKDIRVLGKKDLKQLLQWREQCRQHLGLETEDGDAVKVCLVLNIVPMPLFIVACT
jgi:AdoMet-dependent rRNA methyltransferase SPB1